MKSRYKKSDTHSIGSTPSNSPVSYRDHLVRFASFLKTANSNIEVKDYSARTYKSQGDKDSEQGSYR